VLDREVIAPTGAVPEQFQEIMRWTAQQLDAEHERLWASWPATLRVEIGGLGDVLFCHATPRNDTEIFTCPAERIRDTKYPQARDFAERNVLRSPVRGGNA